MKAIANVTSHAGLDLSNIFPECPLLPLQPERETRTITTVDSKCMAYITSKETGESRWDSPGPHPAGHVRLVLCPDEGGPLWSAYQFLAHNHAAIGFRRDELFLGLPLSSLFKPDIFCISL